MRHIFKGLFAGHDPPGPRVGSGGFQNLAGHVRVGQEVCQISRAGHWWVGSGRVGSVQITLTRSDPGEVVQPVERPDFSFSAQQYHRTQCRAINGPLGMLLHRAALFFIYFFQKSVLLGGIYIYISPESREKLQKKKKKVQASTVVACAVYCIPGRQGKTCATISGIKVYLFLAKSFSESRWLRHPKIVVVFFFFFLVTRVFLQCECFLFSSTTAVGYGFFFFWSSGCAFPFFFFFFFSCFALR